MARNQAADAQDLYDERSSKYDDSHHPRFARHTVELAKVQPGEHVLDLACGTGLISYYASDAVGSTGSVTGVDISTGMLAEAEAKKPKHGLKNVSFYQHSITELNTLETLKGKQFDLITCCSALVLLPEPVQSLKQWVSFLKPGGRLITDATHPNNLITGLVFERVGVAIQRPLPWYRLPFQKSEDLRNVLESAGLHSVEVKLLAQEYMEGTEALEDYITDESNPKVVEEFAIADADQRFDDLIDTHPMKSLASPPEVREEARVVFKEEWSKAADEQGRVQKVDGVFVGIGWKP